MGIYVRHYDKSRRNCAEVKISFLAYSESLSWKFPFQCPFLLLLFLFVLFCCLFVCFFIFIGYLVLMIWLFITHINVDNWKMNKGETSNSSKSDWLPPWLPVLNYLNLVYSTFFPHKKILKICSKHIKHDKKVTKSTNWDTDEISPISEFCMFQTMALYQVLLDFTVTPHI